MAGLPTQILDSLSSGILAVDRENRIIFLNRALLRLLGIDRDEWLGRPVGELLSAIEPHVASPQNFRSGWDWLEDAEAVRTQQIEWREADQVLSLREDSAPLRDTSGEVVGRLFAYHDISREKEIDRMKSEFISIASHELRTPMTSIKGSIDLILSGFAGEVGADTQELLEIAQKSCDRLVRLINDILDLAKIEAGQVKLKLVPMDLAEAVERSIRGLKSLAEQSEVTFKLQKPEALPFVEVDKDRIEQVVTNLLSNAIKFSPPKGEVSIELSAGDGWVQCSVRDQGCGIPEEDLGRVFGKFQQVSDARRKGGTGLGLAITQALVHEHRGKIWVESRVTEGARFIFRLPMAFTPPTR
jgi:PAS domain S-box-containing protein